MSGERASTAPSLHSSSRPTLRRHIPIVLLTGLQWLRMPRACGADAVCTALTNYDALLRVVDMLLARVPGGHPTMPARTPGGYYDRVSKPGERGGQAETRADRESTSLFSVIAGICHLAGT